MRPADGNEIIQRLLKMATMENENPDLRDRLPPHSQYEKNIFN